MLKISLQQLIIERIQREGPITFADYMRMALYEPEYGYYVKGASRVGWEGDFYTSTDVSDFFSHCMGRQLARMWEQLGRPTPFVVLEQGAGRGDLARGVRTWAEHDAPSFYAALAYHTEDINSGHDALSSSPTTSTGNALTPSVILANELIDAFPVHIVEQRNRHLYEVYVTVKDGRLYEELGEPSSEQVASYLDTYAIPWKTYPDGWRAEINVAALQWIEHVAQLIHVPSSSTSKKHSHSKNAFILTIDYGDEAHALYTSDRPQGTLACYFKHQLTERPLTRPGEQDITAHVNFSAVISAGQRHGLQMQTFTTQELWLQEMGLHEELAALRARDFAILDTDRASDSGQVALFKWYNLRQQAAALTDPAGMGNFKVLILQA